MKKALVVDDCKEASGHLSQILTRNGYQVIHADNGEDAINLASEYVPDLIFMDIVMPGVNGFQATRQLSKLAETSHIPVVMVSAKNQDVDKQWAEKQGASAYICKPVEEKLLVKTIDKLSTIEDGKKTA